jgi:hypothetical protein
MNRPACPGTPFVTKDGVTPGSMSKRYPPELREGDSYGRRDQRDEHASEWAAMIVRSLDCRLVGIGSPDTCASGSASMKSTVVLGPERAPRLRGVEVA